MSEKVLFVSHCILNTASKVANSDPELLSREEELRRSLLRLALEEDIGLVQLPCPEFTMYGSRRWGHVREQFDNPFFRSHCRHILEPAIAQLLEYAGRPEAFDLLGIVGIDGSPSCGVSLTCMGNWGGELCDGSGLQETVGTLHMEPQSGVFIEELHALLQENGLDVPVLPLDGDCLHRITYRKKR